MLSRTDRPAPAEPPSRRRRDDAPEEPGEVEELGDIHRGLDESDLPHLPEVVELEGETHDDHPVPDGAHDNESLSRLNLLNGYMQELRRYPLLSREEEHELAVAYARTGDPAIGRRLVTANLRLVVKLAYCYRQAYGNMLDLMQEGNLGLLQAIQRYDPHRGVKLSSFAAWWIRAYMLKFILSNRCLVKIGTTQAQRKLFFNLSREQEKLEAAGFVVSDRLLSERLCVPEGEVTDMRLRLGQSEVSLDAPVGRSEEGGRPLMETLESGSQQRPDHLIEDREFNEALRRKLQAFQRTLRGREQTLFGERLMADQPLTLQEVGARYGISRERARQIERGLLARLRRYLERELSIEAAPC
jgi:RNA polymerase sigma-32 factor